MMIGQKYFPHYWVGHKKDSDDVLLMTARKSIQDSEQAMSEIFGYNWYDNENLEVILVKLEQVVLK